MINRFLQNRAEVNKYIFSAIGLVLVLSLLTNSIMVLLSDKALWVCLCAGGILLVVLVFCFQRIFSLEEQEKEYRGNIFYNSKTKEIVSVRDYFFNNQIQKYMEALFAEDKAAAQKWRKGSLNANYRTQNFSVLGAAVDFYLISLLESVLTDFFERKAEDCPQKFKYYRRTELSAYFKNNLFFQLFTKSMKKRKSFHPGMESSFGKGNKIYHATAFNGAYYERVNFLLPKGTRLLFCGQDSDVLAGIATPHLEVKLRRRYYIGDYYVPLDILLYSSETEKQYMDLGTMEVQVKLQVKFNGCQTLFMPKLNDYKWIDDLNAELEKSVDIHSFQKRLREKTEKYLFEKLLSIEEKIERRPINAINAPKNYIFR